MNEVQDRVMVETKDVHVARMVYFSDTSVVMEAEVGTISRRQRSKGVGKDCYYSMSTHNIRCRGPDAGTVFCNLCRWSTIHRDGTDKTTY